MDDGFPIVVVLGLAIFGMAWVVSQSGGIGTGNGDRPDEVSLFTADPGTVGQNNQDFRTIRFGDFTVGETRGQVQAYTSERERISNGLLSGENIEIRYNATQPGQGQVSFEVLGRRGKGQIYVKVNGNRVFSAATISGATPEINISQTQFNSGMNRIVIGTTQPNPLKKAVYTLEEVEVTVEDRKFHGNTGYFQMYRHELKNFRPSNLTFQIPVDRSIPQQPLQIEVNNQEVFNQVTGRSTQEVTLTPANADLSTGYNTIEFSTDGQSRYTVKNAEFQVRYSISVRPATQTLNFELNRQILNYAQKEKTEETLRFTYQQTTQKEPLKIEINNYNKTVTPENGINTVQLPEEILKEQNRLTVSSDTTFNLENLELVSRKK